VHCILHILLCCALFLLVCRKHSLLCRLYLSLSLHKLLLQYLIQFSAMKQLQLRSPHSIRQAINLCWMPTPVSPKTYWLRYAYALVSLLSTVMLIEEFVSVRALLLAKVKLLHLQLKTFRQPMSSILCMPSPVIGTWTIRRQHPWVAT